MPHAKVCVRYPQQQHLKSSLFLNHQEIFQLYVGLFLFFGCVLDSFPTTGPNCVSGWGHKPIDRHFPSEFFWERAEFMVPLIVQLLRSKAAPDHHISPPCLTFAWIFYFWKCWVIFTLEVVKHTFQNVQLSSLQSIRYPHKSFGNHDHFFWLFFLQKTSLLCFGQQWFSTWNLAQCFPYWMIEWMNQ